MEERCGSCKGLEQEIYWKQFQSMQFCQFLDSDFHSQLMIPEKFSKKLREKMSKKVGLRGPSGSTWDVEVVENGDLLYFRGGWDEFVEAHSLEERDILVFKYSANSQFDVLMFEGGNLCEKESSYFVRKCGHTKQIEDDGMITPLTPLPTTLKVIQGRFPANLVSNSVQDHEPEIGCEEDEMRQNASCIWEPVKLPCSKKMPTKEGKSTLYRLCYVPNRKVVTEEEKLATLRLASKELSEGSFLVVMKSTHVGKRFYLNLPSEWAMIHVVHERQDVILRTNERSWKTTLIFNAAGRGGLSRGWRDFVVDNKLEESDVCVFKLTSPNQKPVVLDVSIFRVVPEVVCPTPTQLITEPSSSHGASPLNKRKFTEMGDNVVEI